MSPGFCSFIICSISVLSLVKIQTVYAGGCSAPPLLPEKPFVVVWNHPSYSCENKGIHLDFAKWGIVDNARDRYFGQKIVLFYSLGKWPSYNKQGQAVNGGIPQLSDLQAHLTKIDDDLKTNVWNQTFNGLGVIDMEMWRPLYHLNWDSKSIYQRQSKALVRKKFPTYNQSQVLEEAIKEFNNAARSFMGETLTKVTAKRPAGKWGYYLFPRCYDANCNTTTIQYNDRISWLFENSTGLYPSIYFKLKTPVSGRSHKTKNTLREAFRVKAKYSSQDIPITVYSKSQEGPLRMYQPVELSLAVLQPADMGVSGVILWGSSSDMRTKNECLILQDYIETTLGPYSRNLMNFFGNCSDQLCQGHGRCVRKDYERIYQQHLRESDREECLIQDELLMDRKDEPKDTENGKQSETESMRYGKSSVRNDKADKVSGLADYRMNAFNLFFQRGKVGKPAVKETDEQGENYSVIRFSVQSEEEINTDSNLPSESRGTNWDTVEPASGGHSPYDDLDDQPPKYGFDPLSLKFDFDDYVCKCYEGYTGDHCEKSDI